MSTSIPGGEGILRQQILARLDEAGRNGLEEGELRRKTDGEGELAKALESLEKEGKAVGMEGRWYATAHTGWVVGVVERLEDGDALIRPGARQDPSFFVRKRNLKRAADRDRVVVRR